MQFLTLPLATLLLLSCDILVFLSSIRGAGAKSCSSSPKECASRVSAVLETSSGKHAVVLMRRSLGLEVG
ncbi:hypothetical protein MUG91_G84n26 [Manis pentadactyla]|nr:hypothetical protein MUG91_G84n26 [Manis pentadactyla]